ATHKARTREPTLPNPEERPSPAAPALDLSFARIARQRRSAVNFDGTTYITKAAFFSMLACLLPRHDTPPWNALMSPAAVHAALMVHRVG
ncbi:nitroreductase, partial [Paraburkholderia sediminicola]